MRRARLSSFNTHITAPALRAKKSAPSSKWRQYLNTGTLIRIITIVLVFIIAFSVYSLADKEINARITIDNYNKINAGLGTIDDPNSTSYGSSVAPWISRLDMMNTLDPNGYDPLSLSPIGVVDLERPDSILSATSLEAALGYVNRQQQVWELHDINPDMSAWLYIYGLGINYPVAVDSKEDDFYLTHSYDRSFSYSGTLFMNPSSSINPIAKNLVIHGHNMKNRTMFGNLQNYVNGTKEFYDSHRYIFLDTLYGTYRYEIFSVYVTNAQDPAYRTTSFGDSNDFIDFCQQLRGMGKYSTAIPFYPEDRILTLSTCNSSDNSKRVIVHARLAYPDPNIAAPATTSPSVTPSPTPSVPTVTNPPSSVYYVKPSDPSSPINLRKEGNTTSGILASLYYGFKVTLLQDGAEWVKIKTEGGLEGYVMKKYLVPESEFSWQVATVAPTSPPTTAPPA